MSKIICDVCGTSYPETATQCPICGCVRPADVTVVAGNTDVNENGDTGNYIYVKGGRFSKSNVKKRNQAQQTSDSAVDSAAQEPEKSKQTDMGLVIAVCVLLLAIVSAVIYIAMNFFGSVPTEQLQPAGWETTAATTTEAGTVDTQATELKIPCQSILISKTSVEFDSVGAGCLLNVTVNPADTTDKIVFSTSDDLVATVSEDGKIVAVGPGEAVITVTCGSVTAQCNVVCRFEVVDATDTTETTAPAETTEPAAPVNTEIKLNREDFSLTYKGQTHTLYKGDIPVKQIIWTSDDEKVATFVDGVVTAVGSGTTTVHAEYNGTKVSCIVRCKPSVGKADENVPEETTAGEYNISATDVTLHSSVSETFELKLLNADNKAVDVVWQVADSSICSVDGNKITALKAGTTKVSATYDGIEYVCIVRVK